MTLAFLLLASALYAEPTRVRNVEVVGDQIVTVKTAIGVATIIQVPDRPASLVVGDSEAFKIEYLDQAITVKPLRFGAKSNLYIYTDWKRFNVQLVTGNEHAADYVVYLKVPMKKQPAPELVNWKDVALSAQKDDLKLSLKRIGWLKGEYVFLEFSLTGKKCEVDPKWFWLTQKGKSKPVHRLLLSTLSLKQDAPLEGLLQVRLKDLNRESLEIEVRRKNMLQLKIPREILWK